MRLRNVKNSAEKIMSSDMVIKDPLIFSGKFKKLFNNNNPIYIEIGMGKGKFIIENAMKHKDINFIGIEKFDNVLVKALDKLDGLNLDNLRFIRMDALDIDKVFNKEIDLIYLNFSDPWPKKRHAKRRLTNKEFLKRYDNVFKGNNHIIMKTDNRKLFEYSIMEFNDYGYKINDISLDLYNDNEFLSDNIQTEYEEKFHNKGFNIYKIDVFK